LIRSFLLNRCDFLLIIRKDASLIFTIYKVSGYTHKVNVGGMFLALMFEAT